MKACLLGASTPVGRVVMRNLSEVPDMQVTPVPAEGPFHEALEGADVAVACIGPDRSAEEAAAKAAIAAGVPYLSGAEAPETFQALTELDEEAASAGSMIVAGLSWTPGLTNLMAVSAAAELDQVTQVRIAWTGSCLGPLGPPLLSRAIRAFSGDAVVFENDGWHLEAAGSQRERIFFPEPAGWRNVAICAAAEPLSIPESIEGVQKVWVKGGIFEPWAQPMALRASDPWGASSDRPAELTGPSRLAASMLSRVASDAAAWSSVRVDVWGNKSGKPETVTLGMVDHLQNLMAAPLVAAATLVGRGRPEHRGVVAADQAFDPKKLFSLLGERGVRLARLDQDRVPAQI